MSELVKSLRELYFEDGMDPVFREAAYRIEALERALREVLRLEDSVPTHYPEWKQDWNAAVKQAREVLGKYPGTAKAS